MSNEAVKLARYKAFQTNFELACIFAMVVIFADMTWLLHDIVHNGLNAWYVVVGSFMIIGQIGTGAVLVRHNRTLTRRHCHKTLVHKLKVLKHVHKAKGISHSPRREAAEKRKAAQACKDGGVK